MYVYVRLVTVVSASAHLYVTNTSPEIRRRRHRLAGERHFYKLHIELCGGIVHGVVICIQSKLITLLKIHSCLVTEFTLI